MHSNEQASPMTLSVRPLLHTTDNLADNEISQQALLLQPPTYQSPDSSMNTLHEARYDDISSITSDSSGPSSQSVLASSESILRQNASIPVAMTASNSYSQGSEGSGFSSDPVFKLPQEPLLLQKYIQTMSRPGPKSLKRKRIQELINNNSQHSLSQNTPPDFSSQPRDDEESLILQKLLERAKPLKKKHRSRDRSGSQNSTSSSIDSSLSSRALQIDLSGASEAPPLSVIPTMSPFSSQQVHQSPSLEPTRIRRLPSSSLSSQEDLIPEAQIVKARGTKAIKTKIIQPPSSTSSDDSPALTANARTDQRVTRDDSNAHSNKAAPRRVRIPTPPRSNSPVRDPRPANSKVNGKLIHGG